MKYNRSRNILLRVNLSDTEKMELEMYSHMYKSGNMSSYCRDVLTGKNVNNINDISIIELNYEISKIKNNLKQFESYIITDDEKAKTKQIIILHKKIIFLLAEINKLIYNS